MTHYAFEKGCGGVSNFTSVGVEKVGDMSDGDYHYCYSLFTYIIYF